MSTPLSYLVNRAAEFSTANAGIGASNYETIACIRREQRGIFAKTAVANRDYLAASATLQSTNASVSRVVSLIPPALPAPCARVLQLLIASTQTPVSIIDITDPNADLAPRGAIFGQTIVEVGNDWSAGPGAVAMLLYYIQGPIDLNPLGDLTQVISLPDDWNHLLVLALAAYYAHKDVGRDPAEIARLDSMYSEAQQDWISYVTEQGGAKTFRFRIPAPISGGQPGPNKE